MTFLIILGLVLLVFHFALWNYFAFGRKPPEDSTGGTVIVLGCKIHDERPSLMLRGRLDAALSYLNAHPESMCVVTGGQGKNEAFTEAHTMALYLRESGIQPDRIREEGQARNTDENLKYSLEIIREQSLPGPYIICTDGFHQMRAFVYAQKYGAETFAISGRTPFWLVPAYALREIPALVKAFLFP